MDSKKIVPLRGSHSKDVTCDKIKTGVKITRAIMPTKEEVMKFTKIEAVVFPKDFNFRPGKKG